MGEKKAKTMEFEQFTDIIKRNPEVLVTIREAAEATSSKRRKSTHRAFPIPDLDQAVMIVIVFYMIKKVIRLMDEPWKHTLRRFSELVRLNLDELIDELYIKCGFEDRERSRADIEAIVKSIKETKDERVLEAWVKLLDEMGESPRRRFLIQRGYVFIIMAMLDNDPQLNAIHKTIIKTCKICGLEAERIDDIKHTGRITEKIKECIRKAEVVIADLTYNRPNCFYEVGYAHRWDKDVIFTARKGTKPQFDIQDYPIIFYKDLETLRDELSSLLKVVLGEIRNYS